MTDLIVQIGDGVDDGYVTPAPFNLYVNNLLLRVGPTQIDVWYKWDNITIPNGATINSAIVTYTALNTFTETNAFVNNIYFNDEDTAVAPISSADYYAKNLTSEIVWSDSTSWVNNSTYDSPELKTILQTIISRASWASGNSIMILHKYISGTKRSFNSYDNDPTKSPKITIDYTSGRRRVVLTQ